MWIFCAANHRITVHLWRFYGYSTLSTTPLASCSQTAILFQLCFVEAEPEQSGNQQAHKHQCNVNFLIGYTIYRRPLGVWLNKPALGLDITGGDCRRKARVWSSVTFKHCWQRLEHIWTTIYICTVSTRAASSCKQLYHASLLTHEFASHDNDLD